MTLRFATLALLLGCLGACEVDPYCPECVDGAVTADAGPDATDKVIATGGGGSVRHCAVGAPGVTTGAGHLGALTASAAFVAALVAHRRRR